MSEVSLQDQIKCIRRELAMRESAYPKWVRAGRMKQENADRELARMTAVLGTLQRLDPNYKPGHMLEIVEGKPVRGKEV